MGYYETERKEIIGTNIKRKKYVYSRIMLSGSYINIANIAVFQMVVLGICSKHVNSGR